MPQPQPQQGGFVILPLPQAVAGAPPHPPRCNGKLSWVVPPVVPDPVVHFPVILTPPGPPHVRVFSSPHDRWGGGLPEPVIPDGAPFSGPVHPGPFMGHPMDDGSFVPHSPSDGSPPQVIVLTHDMTHDIRVHILFHIRTAGPQVRTRLLKNRFTNTHRFDPFPFPFQCPWASTFLALPFRSHRLRPWAIRLHLRMSSMWGLLLLPLLLACHLPARWVHQYFQNL